MNKNKAWNEFLETLIEINLNEFKNTKEYEYLHKRNLCLNEMLEMNLTKSQKDMVEEIIFEFGLADNRCGNLLYLQGMKDCVIMLKNLGVLA